MLNKQAAQLLFDELYRVKGSNSTRRHLEAVLKTLVSFPLPLVEEGFQRLCVDAVFSVRTRAKFRFYLERLRD